VPPVTLEWEDIGDGISLPQWRLARLNVLTEVGWQNVGRRWQVRDGTRTLLHPLVIHDCLRVFPIGVIPDLGKSARNDQPLPGIVCWLDEEIVTDALDHIEPTPANEPR